MQIEHIVHQGSEPMRFPKKSPQDDEFVLDSAFFAR